MSGFYIVDSNGTMIELMKPIEDLSVIMPDEYEERADEMIDLLQGLTEPVTFTCPLKNPKRVKRILRRLAKRNGREWRLYKVKAKWRAKATVRTEVRKWVQGLTRHDCVGLVPGYCWNGEEGDNDPRAKG
ncbi:MAG: hypothetical protein J6Y26_06510, partial [Lachnospiraceae bacterium]|nr:hypothetical protein [Lachnospiraceae bacterium]